MYTLSLGDAQLWTHQEGNEWSDQSMRGSGHSAGITDVAFSSDGALVGSASLDKKVVVWDVESGTEALTLAGHAGEVYSVAFMPQGDRLVSSSYDKTVKVTVQLTVL